MADADLTVAVLREIRDAVRTTNDKLDQTRDAVRTTNDKLDQTRVELGQRIDETNQRLDVVETTLKDLAGQQLILTRYIKNVVDRHDQAIDELRERVTRLEVRSEER